MNNRILGLMSKLEKQKNVRLFLSVYSDSSGALRREVEDKEEGEVILYFHDEEDLEYKIERECVLTAIGV